MLAKEAPEKSPVNALPMFEKPSVKLAGLAALEMPDIKPSPEIAPDTPENKAPVPPEINADLNASFKSPPFINVAIPEPSAAP